MANLSIVASWDEVYQLETTDTALGGAPDGNPGVGTLNIPNLALGNRTAWLRDALTGWGGELPQVADLNALAISGVYRADAGATGHPNPGSEPVSVIHLQGANGKGSQAAFLTDGFVATRHRAAGGAAWGAWDRGLARSHFEGELPNNNFDDALETGVYSGFGVDNNTPSGGDNPFAGFNGVCIVQVWNPEQGGAAAKAVQVAYAIRSNEPEVYVRVNNTGAWAPWHRLWHGQFAEDQVVALFSESVAQNGYDLRPNGVLEQWGYGNLAADKTAVTFPIAFPAACHNVVICDVTGSSAGQAAVGLFGVEPDTLSTTGFVARVEDGASGNFFWRAIGN